MTRTRHRSIPWVLAAALLLRSGGLVQGACPASPCDCVGEARNFNLVASKKMSIMDGRLAYYGYAYFIEAFVEGDLCTRKLIARGPVGHPTSLYDALASEPRRAAGTFRKRDPYGYGDSAYGVAAGLVATGGGTIRGETNLAAYEIDTTGTHPRIAECEQAIADMETASATLAALTPTQDLGSVRVRGDYLEIYVEGPGVHVLRADQIRVGPRNYYGYPQGGELYIDTDGQPDAVIVNTGGLSVGELSVVYADPATTIINVVGRGPSIKVGQFGTVEPPILAPDRNVVVGLQLGDFAVGTVMASRIRFKGSTAFDGFSLCP